MKIEIRPHRGTLEDAMKEAAILKSFSQIRDYVIDHWDTYVGKIEYYCYDTRLNGETFLITDNEGRAIGFVVLYE